MKAELLALVVAVVVLGIAWVIALLLWPKSKKSSEGYGQADCEACLETSPDDPNSCIVPCVDTVAIDDDCQACKARCGRGMCSDEYQAKCDQLCARSQMWL